MSEATPALEMRRVFGRALVEHGRADPRIVVLDNDSGATTMAGMFDQAFPDRYFDVGIAEKNLFGTAAGLAASGFVPVATTFAVFATRCALDRSRCRSPIRRSTSRCPATTSGRAAPAPPTARSKTSP